MANNRMVLVCNICQPPTEDWKYYFIGNEVDLEKGVLPINKYFPCIDSGWGFNPPGINIDRWNEFVNLHNHEEVDWDIMIGPTHFRLDYEIHNKEK